MGINYYLRRVRPREVRDYYHVAKKSYGWVTTFEASDGYDHTNGWAMFDDTPDADARPAVRSVDDIRRLVRDGTFSIVDEDGCDVPLDKFESDVVRWGGGRDAHGERFDNPRVNTYHHYLDHEGNNFCREEFS